MRIVMVGEAAVGKTTLMTSTYGLMREGRIKGFQIKCKNEQADKKLRNAYDNFRSKGMYPSATVRMSSYEYEFYSNEDWVMDFILTDINGEIIHTTDATAISKLYSELKEADAMMLFLSAYDIINGKDIEEQIEDIYTLLNNAFIVDGRQKMIMVVFSQVDKIRGFTNETMKLLESTVQELKTMTDKNEDIVFLTVPTACSVDCMMDLDFTIISLMLIGYYNEVAKRRQVLENELEQIKRLYGEGFFRDAKEVFLEFFWKDKERREARKRAIVLEEEIKKYDIMIEKFNKLKEFCENYEMGTYYSIKKAVNSGQYENPFDL